MGNVCCTDSSFTRPPPPAGPSPALKDYTAAFEYREAEGEAPFITFYSKGSDPAALDCDTYTRAEFWALTRRAATVLLGCGIGRGDRVTHYFRPGPWSVLFHKVSLLDYQSVRAFSITPLIQNAVVEFYLPWFGVARCLQLTDLVVYALELGLKGCGHPLNAVPYAL